eukprot:GHVS01031970.1.p1 GENE.GHVS01031970.1~~GHVS01031970.1.p1  ORF type:complete len:712 (-),score=108.02 GHVS01031970.1:52-2187(-)
MVEYLEPAIRRALGDVNGYVRRCAVIGCVKLFHISSDSVYGSDLVDTIYALIYDIDTQVAANAIHALNEILIDEGGLLLTKDIAVHLLNRIKQFNEWGQCAILNLICSYIPSGEAEMFDIMNILEERLKHSSSAVVLGCTKCFVEMTLDKPALQLQVLHRLKAPLLTLMSTSTSELAYTVLLHIHLLLHKGDYKIAGVMEADYRQFFCRYSDPTYIKTVKLDILTLIATQSNVESILAEASEYVGDVDADIANRSIHALGTLAIKIPSAVGVIVQQLLTYLELDIDYVTTATLRVMKDILRKFPEHFDDISPSVSRCAKTATDSEAVAAVVWILGEFGECVPDSPYLIESMINGFTEDGTCLVRLELLTAAVKLFIKRPPEMQTVLGALLKKGVQEWTQPEVHDKALFYYRLLKYSLPQTRRIVNCPKARVTFFQEDIDKEAVERLFFEFNTFSVVYGQPAAKFCVVKQIPFYGRFVPKAAAELVVLGFGKPATSSGADSCRSNQVVRALDDGSGDDRHVRSSSGNSETGDDVAATTSMIDIASSSSSMEGGDLIGLVDDVEDKTLRLRSDQPSVDAEMFQRIWCSLSSCAVLRTTLNTSLNMADVEAACTAAHIYTMASGSVEGPSGQMKKLYLYAQDTQMFYYFVEMLVANNNNNNNNSTALPSLSASLPATTTNSSVDVNIRTTGTVGQQFAALFCVALKSIIPSLRG